MPENQKIVISSKFHLFDFKLKELSKYRDLIFLFLKRNYSTRYKQKILGPAWLIITPLLTVCIQTLVFGKLAGLSTDGVPLVLFYLAGNIAWGYFANIVSGCAGTFLGNAFIFGKVYFPRLVAPLSHILTCTVDFFIHLLLFLAFDFAFAVKFGTFYFSWRIILLPLLLFQLAILGMGVGLIISAITVKYKDLQILISFGLQFWMYATPVVYSTSIIPEQYTKLFAMNPAAPSVVIFKNLFFSTDSAWLVYLPCAFLTSVIFLILGIICFNAAERTFLDTI